MGKHGDLAAASWELVAISIASWTLRCRASRVRWSTGSTLWMSTLVTTSPLGAKQSCSRKCPLSSKPNTAEQMRRFEFWGHWGHQHHLGMLRPLGQWGHWGTYRASLVPNRAEQNSLFEFLGHWEIPDVPSDSWAHQRLRGTTETQSNMQEPQGYAE